MPIMLKPDQSRADMVRNSLREETFAFCGIFLTIVNVVFTFTFTVVQLCTTFCRFSNSKHDRESQVIFSGKQVKALLHSQ